MLPAVAKSAPGTRRSRALMKVYGAGRGVAVDVVVHTEADVPSEDEHFSAGPSRGMRRSRTRCVGAGNGTPGKLRRIVNIAGVGDAGSLQTAAPNDHFGASPNRSMPCPTLSAEGGGHRPPGIVRRPISRSSRRCARSWRSPTANSPPPCSPSPKAANSRTGETISVVSAQTLAGV